MKFRKCLSYDDVLLVPLKSKIESREQVNIGTKLGENPELSFSFPVIVSPMDTLVGSEMVLTMDEFGGLAIIHRYNTIKEQSSIIEEIILKNSKANIFAAIGVTGDFFERAKILVNNYHIDGLCVDVAHGHHILMEKALKVLRQEFGNRVHLMAGNVATKEGYIELSCWGADSVRVGVGGGSICVTKTNTGHGVPTLESILMCNEYTGTNRAKIIADGGIKNAGDVVKALAAGAHMVMAGSLFAGTDQCPGPVEVVDGKLCKSYSGMASESAQKRLKHGNFYSLEGVATTVPYRGDLKPILEKLKQNIKSGFSYSGASNLAELHENAEFIEQTSAGLKENGAHILDRVW